MGLGRGGNKRQTMVLVHFGPMCYGYETIYGLRPVTLRHCNCSSTAFNSSPDERISVSSLDSMGLVSLMVSPMIPDGLFRRC